MKEDGWRLSILAWLPGFVVFFLVPTVVYLPNQEDLHFDLLVLAPYFALCAAGFPLLERARRLWPSFCGKVYPVLFYAGLFLLLRDLVAPLTVGEVAVGWDAVPVPEPPASVFREACLALSVAAAGFFFPKDVLRRHVPPAILFLLAAQTAFLLVHIDWSGMPALRGAGPLAAEYAPGQRTDKPNIYHITFDSFSSHRFPELLREVSSRQAFDGFRFFPRNKANYLFTGVSRASYMTGTFYRGGDLDDWMGRWKTSGLFHVLGRGGYTVTDYSNSGVKGVPIARRDTGDVRMELINHTHFADLWFLRLVPTACRQEVFQAAKSAGVFTQAMRRAFPASTVDALPLAHRDRMRRLIADEAKRPDRGQYVWAHLYLPHAPYNLDRRCGYRADSGYDEQAMCAIRLMGDLIKELKDRGRYDSSVIVFHSDHGSIAVDPSGMSPDFRKRIDSGSESGRSGQAVLDLSSSLLLVKPPGSSGAPLEVSGRLTQLADIPATVYGVIGVRGVKTEGADVLGSAPDAGRSIEIFDGFDRKDGEGGTQRFGKGVRHGYFDHYRYGLGKGWELREKLPVDW